MKRTNPSGKDTAKREPLCLEKETHFTPSEKGEGGRGGLTRPNEERKRGKKRHGTCGISG